MDAAVVFFFALWALLGGSPVTPRAPSKPQGPEAKRLPPATGTPVSAPPWPQVVPSGLPSFPGSGWEYDEPPPKEVQARAGQLLQQLWNAGSGTYRIEQTGGRWISYRAEVVKSGKKGVVAYRLKNAAAAPATPPATAKAPPKAPAPAPARAPAPAAPAKPAYTATSPGQPQKAWDVEVGPAAMPSPVLVSTTLPHPPAPPDISALPDRKYGDGMKPKPSDPFVLLAQQKLAALGFLHSAPDGAFGNDTRNAAIAFQVQAGLAPAGQTPEQLKARGFGAVKQATWQALFAVRA